MLAPIQVEADAIVPPNTTTLSQEKLSQQGSGAFAQGALKKQAGINVVQMAGPGSLTSSSIRGLHANHTLVTLYGVPLNTSSLAGQHNLFAYFPTEFISSLEIIRGAQGVIWGPHGMGGVVKLNPIMKDQNGISGVAEGGSFGTFKTASTYGIQSENTQFFAGVHHFQTDGLNGVQDGPKYGERNRYRQENVLISGTQTVTETFQVAGFAHGMRSENIFDNSAFDPGVQKGKGTTDDLLIGVRADHDGLSGLIQQSVTVSQHDMLAKQKEAGYSTRTKAHTFYGRYENRIEWHEGQITTIGGTLDQESLKVFGAKNRDVHSKALFGSHESIVKFLTLTGGIRVHDHGRFGSRTLYKLGAAVTHTLSSMTATLFSHFGTGFRPPTLSDLFSKTLFSKPNPSLRPETNKMIDAGVEFKKQTPWPIKIGITVFQNRSKNLISSRSIQGKFMPINIGKARSRGTESTLSISPLNSLTFEGTHTYTRAKDKTPNAPDNGIILRQPKHQLSGTVIVTPRDNVSTFTSVTHTTKRSDRDFSTGQLVKLKPYTVVSAGGSYRVTPSTKIFVRLENMFNKNYTQVHRYATPPRGIYGGLKWTQNP